MALRTTSVALGGLLLLLGACAVRAVGNATAAGKNLPFSTVAKGFSSGILEPLQVVIRNREEWAAVWQRHTRTQVGGEPAPSVDFSRDMVVGVFMGERATGGYEIGITRVERTGTELRVHYRATHPDPGAMLAQVLTQPYHLIKIPRDSRPLVFVHEGPSR